MKKPKLLYVRDRKGISEPLPGFTVSRTDDVEAEKSITVSGTRDEFNHYGFDLIANRNYFVYDGEEYLINKRVRKLKGRNTRAVDVSCNHRIFDDLKSHRIYKKVTGTYTLEYLLDLFLSGSGYAYIIDKTDLVTELKVEGFGDKNGKALLEEFLEFLNAEYDYANNVIYIAKKIGKITDKQFRHRFNINDFSEETNSENFATYIRGYGKKKEETDGETEEFISYTSKKGQYYIEPTENKQATKEIGATFSFDFTGTGFNFKTIVHKMGGNWVFKVDSTTKTITTYAASTAEKTFEVIRGLEDKKHTVVATFKKDTNNPNTKKKQDIPFNYLLEGDIIGLFSTLTGDDQYTCVVEYTSPLAAEYGILHADPFTSDTITDKDELMKETIKSLYDSFDINITLSAEELDDMGLSELRKGDYAYCLVDPFDIDLQFRVMSITDYSDPYKSPEFTFGTIKKKNTTIAIASFGSTQKTVSATVDSNTNIVKDAALSENVQKAIKTSQVLGDLSSLPEWAQNDIASAILQMYESANEINVRQPPWNLKGDGTDEKEILQQLFDLADGDGSVHLYFPEGVYGMSNYLRLYSNTFARLHPNAVIKRLGTGYKVFVNGELGDSEFATGYDGEGNIHFVGGCIDCNAFENPLAADKATTAFDLAHGENISFVNVEMKNNQNGHFVQIASCKNVLFNGCYIHDVNHLDSEYMNCEAIQIEVATDVSFPSFGGYDSTPSQNIRIIDCNFENLVRGIGTHGYPVGEDGLPSVYCFDIIIERCQFKNIVDNAISLLAYKRVTIANVHMEDIGGYALWARYLYDSTIDKLSCDRVGKSGIYMQYSDDNEIGKITLENTCETDGYSAIRLDNADNNVFRNPVVKGTTHRWAFFATSCENNRLYDYNFKPGTVGTIGGDSLPLVPSFTTFSS